MAEFTFVEDIAVGDVVPTRGTVTGVRHYAGVAYIGFDNEDSWGGWPYRGYGWHGVIRKATEQENAGMYKFVEVAIADVAVGDIFPMHGMVHAKEDKKSGNIIIHFFGGRYTVYVRDGIVKVLREER